MIKSTQNVPNVFQSAFHVKRNLHTVQSVQLIGKTLLNVLLLMGISMIKTLGKSKNAKRTVRHAKIQKIIVFLALKIG